MIHLSIRIRKARRWGGLCQRELAQRLGVTRGAVANWESSGASAPTTLRLAQLAKTIGVSHEWLTTGRGSMIPGTALADTRPQQDVHRGAPNETRLLQAFRAITDRDRTAVLEFIEAKVRSSCPARSRHRHASDFDVISLISPAG